MAQQTNQSEVSRLLSRIEAEYQAAQNGLHGFAEGARHAFVTARMVRIGELHEELHQLVGNESMALISRQLAAAESGGLPSNGKGVHA